MKTILFITTMMVYTFSVSGQITFNRSYDLSDGFEDSGWFVLADEEGYTVLSASKCFNNALTCTKLLRTDLEGNVIWTRTFDNSPYLLRPGGDFIHTADGGYLIAGDTYNGNDFEMFLLRLDSEGNELWRKFYNGDKQDFARDVLAYPTGGYIIHGDGKNPNERTDKVIVKTDFEGNVEWDTKLNLDQFFQSSELGGMAMEPDGHTAIAYRAAFQSLPDSTVVSRISPTGELLWTKKMHAEFLSCTGNIQLMPDGNYIFTTCAFNPDFSVSPETAMVAFIIMDKDGNILKEKNLYTWIYKSVISMRVTSNGDIIACGRDDTNINLPSNTKTWVVRLNSDLEVLWERQYQSAEHPYNVSFGGLLGDLKETADGGIILSGMMFDTLENGMTNPNVWLVKLDADGCQVPGCSGGEIWLDTEEANPNQPNAENYFTAIPNPASDFIQIKFQNPVPEKSDILIFDFLGRSVFETSLSKGQTFQEIDVNRLPVGVYSVVLHHHGQILQTEKIIISASSYK